MRLICSLSVVAVLAAALCAAWADDKDPKRPTSAAGAKAAPQASLKTGAKPGSEPGAKESGAKEPGAKEILVKTDDGGETATVISEAEGADEPVSKYPAEEAQLLKTAEAFVQAYAKHDAKAVAALYAADAEYIDADGEVFQGRTQIEETLGEFFKDHPDCNLTLDIDSIRFLSPLLAIEDGTTICTAHHDGSPEESRYTAIHTKLDGRWQLASVREHGAPNPRQHAQRLQQLDWLIGNWVDEDDDSVVQFNCHPSDDGNFLLRDFDVSVSGETVIHGTQRIGWDALSGKFRVWTFDSEGGHFEGFLSRDNDRWILTASGVTADGQPASGKAIFTPENNHTITWQAIDREIDGERIEDSEEFNLVKKGPQPEGQASAAKAPTEPKK